MAQRVQTRVAKPLHAISDPYNVAQNEWLVQRQITLKCDMAFRRVLNVCFRISC